MKFRGTLAPKAGSNRNRKLKSAAFGLFTGFLLLAPPGTLIVLSLFLIGIFGKAVLLVLIGLALIVLTALWLKRKARHRTEES
jgi:hypothetical protein